MGPPWDRTLNPRIERSQPHRRQADEAGQTDLGAKAYTYRAR
jgi:hypothetical protein